MSKEHVPYEQLISYAAGELNEVESIVVAAHLATCAACAGTVAHFKTVRQLVRGDLSIDPPLATITHVRAILHHRLENCPGGRGHSRNQSVGDVENAVN